MLIRFQHPPHSRRRRDRVFGNACPHSILGRALERGASENRWSAVFKSVSDAEVGWGIICLSNDFEGCFECVQAEGPPERDFCHMEARKRQASDL